MPLVKRSDDPTKGDEHDDKIVDDAVAAQQERIQKIVTIIDTLNIDTDYTADNIPKVGAIEDKLGSQITVTAEERDQAFEIYNG